MLTKESAARKDSTTGATATLQHRHFAFIAAVVQDETDLFVRGRIARRFADACARCNPRFDRARFMLACKVEDHSSTSPASIGTSPARRTTAWRRNASLMAQASISVSWATVGLCSSNAMATYRLSASTTATRQSAWCGRLLIRRGYDSQQGSRCKAVTGSSGNTHRATRNLHSRSATQSRRGAVHDSANVFRGAPQSAGQRCCARLSHCICYSRKHT